MSIPQNAKILIDEANSKLWMLNNFTDDYYEQLCSLEMLVEPPIRYMGKTMRQQRNISFLSDTSHGYRYSGQIIKSKPLSDHPYLVDLTQRVNDTLGTGFNGILVNSYENGSKYISAHSDEEAGLDKTRCVVAALSYGATRKFRIRDKLTNAIRLDVDATPRSLLVMEGDFQKVFKHEVPKQLKIKDRRISLTFRQHTI